MQYAANSHLYGVKYIISTADIGQRAGSGVLEDEKLFSTRAINYYYKGKYCACYSLHHCNLDRFSIIIYTSTNSGVFIQGV